MFARSHEHAHNNEKHQGLRQPKLVDIEYLNVRACSRSAEAACRVLTIFTFAGTMSMSTEALFLSGIIYIGIESYFVCSS